jgi:hypothetical protein
LNHLSISVYFRDGLSGWDGLKLWSFWYQLPST